VRPPAPDSTVDVVVVGMGVAGEAVAGELAAAGLDVVGVESQLVGGECPSWGCIPSKMMVRAAGLVAETRRVEGIAGKASVAPDWAQVAQRIRDDATDNWDDRVAVDRFTDQGGPLPAGTRTARRPWPARRRRRRRRGTSRRGPGHRDRPLGTPPVAGLADTPYWTNRDAVATADLPASLIVLRGGAIGLELAQVFARFGVAVTVVEALDRLLAAGEPEVSDLIEEVLTTEGVSVTTAARVVGAAHDGRQFDVRLADGQTLSAERLLVATGRRVDLTGLGVDTVGLDPQARSVTVDEQMRAGDGLWAVGDVTGHGAFTHVGTYQAKIAVRDILGAPGPPADYDAVPRVTFTDPEVGAVGLTAAQARDSGIAVRTGVAHVPSSARGWIHKAGNDDLIKLVADADTGLLVGATSAGPSGGEVLGALAVAVHGQVPVERLRHMIYAYPSFHRGIEDALRDLDA
jgi:pyruvate/2-oxoglutarate dehydrogenase complex dihydrolipoamide dehydrogenase (E3) component